jgi:hypothetical protein
MARAIGLVALCLAFFACDGDRAATADVARQSYLVGDAGDIDLDGVALRAYAHIDRMDYSDWLLERTAYASTTSTRPECSW